MAQEAGAGDGPDAARASRLVLAPDPRAVSTARAFVRSCCRLAGVDGDASETAVLLTSETVTNAFIHGRSEARLAVTVRAGSLLIEVGDDNRQAPQLADQYLDAVSGRGMAILDVLASSWDTTEDAAGKTVRFEVRTA